MAKFELRAQRDRRLSLNGVVYEAGHYTYEIEAADLDEANQKAEAMLGSDSKKYGFSVYSR